ITRTGTYTVLYNFDTTHGAQPDSPLVQGSDGNFYGTTSNGGTDGAGIVFKITPGGKLTVLRNLDGTADGQAPLAGLVQATDGNFYGVTSTAGSGATVNGAIFRVSPIGTYTVVHPFSNADGIGPEVTLFQHTNGILYGDTRTGGTGCCGVFYSFNIGAV